MYKEIGSEFWIENKEFEKRNNLEWISKFGDFVLTSSGRSAISLLLKQINPINKIVLLPSYICESVILPFVVEGYSCAFYDIDLNFNVSFDIIKKYPKVGIFFHMGYFGFFTNIKMEEIINYYRSNYSIIIEDVTHTLFSNRKKNIFSDYYICSIRKWFGLPSGGFLASTHNQIHDYNLIEHKAFVELRKKGMELKSKYINDTENISKEKFLKIFKEAEKIIDEDLNIYSIDYLSKNILFNIDINKLIETRKQNYKYLFAQLNNCITLLFNYYDEDVCPLFFPILLKDNREYIINILSNNNIFCPIHWPVPKKFVDLTSHENAKRLYEKELSIPCDHRYGKDEMDRIIITLRKLF